MTRKVLSSFLLSLLVLFSALPAEGQWYRRAQPTEPPAEVQPDATPKPQRPTTPPPPIVLDAHVDSLHRILDRGDDLSETLMDGQVDLNKLRIGGINVVWFALWVDQDKYKGEAATKRALALYEALQKQVARHSDRLAFCRTSADVKRAAAEGKIAALAGIENGSAINNDLRLISTFHNMGVTRMVITWRGNLPWAAASQADNPKLGLSALGREVIREMNRVGMVVDLSHSSKQTALDALDASSLPVIFSHSNASAITPQPRNIDDELLTRLKQNGGVVGVNFYDKFARPAGRSFLDRRRPTLDDVLDHLDHMVKIAGIDHVGIGSDWDGGIEPVVGLENASHLPSLFEGMRRRGYSEGDIRKVAGENFLRVLEANEQGARKEIDLPPTLPPQ